MRSAVLKLSAQEGRAHCLLRGKEVQSMIKKHKKLLAYMLALAVFSTYVVMDTFVISRVYSEASGAGSEAALQADDQSGSDETADREGQTDSGNSGNAEDSERGTNRAAVTAGHRLEEKDTAENRAGQRAVRRSLQARIHQTAAHQERKAARLQRLSASAP